MATGVTSPELIKSRSYCVPGRRNKHRQEQRDAKTPVRKTTQTQQKCGCGFLLRVQWTDCLDTWQAGTGMGTGMETGTGTTRSI